MALNQDAGEQPAVDTTPVSEQEVTEEVSEEVTESTEEVAETETETGGESRKGATQRIRELNSKAKTAEQRASEAEAREQSLLERIAQLTGSSEPDITPQMPQFEPGAEYTPEQYQQHVAAAAGTIVDLKLKQQNAINRIQSETAESMRAYPELDPKSDSFDSDLSKSVTEAVEAKVRANPYSANVKTFVDGLMKPYKRAVTKEVGKVSEKLASQVSQAAVRPTQIKKNEKSLEEKSIEELERELGIYQS